MGRNAFIFILGKLQFYTGQIVSYNEIAVISIYPAFSGTGRFALGGYA
jgi:hypothetical protein